MIGPRQEMIGDSMNRKSGLLNVITGVMLGLLIMFSVGAVTGGRTTWDYRIIKGRASGVPSTLPPLSQQLDQAAAEGWEVASAASDDGLPFVILRRAR